MTTVVTPAEDMPKALTLRLFGGVKAEVGGKPLLVRDLRSAKGLYTLAYLAVNHRNPISRPALANILWPHPLQTPDIYLNEALRDLRRALGDPPRRPVRLCAAGHGYLQLMLQPGDFVDVAAFDETREDASRGSADAWQRMADLYSGPLLHGWENKEMEEETGWGHWVSGVQAQYRRFFLSALKHLHAAAVRDERPEDALGCLRRMAAAGDTSESGWCGLMEFFEERGDFETFRRVRAEFREHFPSPSAAVRELWKRVPEPAAAATQAQALDLPYFFTAAFGREALLEEIKTAVTAQQARFVVLAGIGGIGKTRLAAQLAQRLHGHFRHGAVYADLAPVTDPAVVALKVSQALKTRPEQLAAHLRPQEMLLVLDNCEQLQDACAVFIRELLAACPSLHIVAASREAFNLGEVLWNVPGLDCPPADPPPSVGTVADFPACRLFLDRARRAAPLFRLTDSNAAAVSEICRRTAGIPLALELVAAHLRVIPTAEELLAASAQFLDLEIGGGEYARHTRQADAQTLRGIIGWSYDTLNDREKRLLRRLSVFAGDWTRAASGTVCLDAGEDAAQTGLLKSLTDKGLLAAEPGEEQSRYRLLETIRQFAADALLETGEGAAIREKHRDHFLILAESVGIEWDGPEQDRWLRRIAAEYENLRAALAWSVSEADALKSLRLCAALGQFWSLRGLYAEGLGWFVQALAIPGTDNPETKSTENKARAKTLYLAGRFALDRSDSGAAQAYAEESLTISQALDDRRGIASALTCLGHIALWRGSPAPARRHYEAGLTLCREMKDRSGIASCLSDLAGAASALSDFAGARMLYEESLHLYRETGNKIAAAYQMNNIGSTAQVQGALEVAQDYLEQSLAVFREIGDKRSAAVLLRNLGLTAEAQGRLDDARRYLGESLALRLEIKDPDRAGVLSDLGRIALYQKDYNRAYALCTESLDIARQIENPTDIAVSLHGLGEVALRQGDLRRARGCYTECLTLFQQVGDRRGTVAVLEAGAAFAVAAAQAAHSGILFGAAAALREDIKMPLQSSELADNKESVAAARQAVGDADFAVAWAQGQALSADEAAAYVLSYLAEPETREPETRE